MESLETKTDTTGFTPSEKQSAVASRILKRFDDMKSERDKPRREFDGRTITQYVNDNVDSYNGIVSEDMRSTKEDWQSLIFDNKARGKVKTIVALMTSNRPYINLVGTSAKDEVFADEMMKVYDDSWQRENGAYELFKEVLSAAVKGTVIVEEGYYEQKKTVKEVSSYDPTTGEAEFKEKEVIEGGAGRVYARIVPLLNFYPNENSADIMNDCIVMDYPSMEEFKLKYGKYKNAEYVAAGLTASSIGNVLYKRVKEDQSDIVEILKYYNEIQDEFVILANGIWINPQKKDTVCPLPYDHKRLGFCKTVFELADEECFYGKALPDLMAGETETSNAILRMIVDQEILSIHKPILLGSGIELEGTNLFPGKQMRATGDITQIRELAMSGASMTSFNLLEYLDKRANINTSVDPNTQGVHQGRKTAREAVILDENAKRIAGTFQILVYKLLLDRATLRISNIKQFYRQPIQYRPITDMDSRPILDAQGQPQKMPVYRSLTITEPGKKPYWVTLTPELCRANFEVRIEEDYEIAETRTQRIEIARALLDEAKVNPLLDADQTTIDYLVSMGKNPSRFYISPTPKEAPEAEGMPMEEEMEGEMQPQGQPLTPAVTPGIQGV